jgi:hypothetical protein
MTYTADLQAEVWLAEAEGAEVTIGVPNTPPNKGTADVVSTNEKETD